MHEHDKSGNKLAGVTQDKAGERGAELSKEGKELQREITVLRKQVFDEWQEGIIDRLGDFKLDLVGRCKLTPLKTRASKSPKSKRVRE